MNRPNKPGEPAERHRPDRDDVHTGDPAPKPETPGARVVEDIEPDEMDPDQVRTPI